MWSTSYTDEIATKSARWRNLNTRMRTGCSSVSCTFCGKTQKAPQSEPLRADSPCSIPWNPRGRSTVGQVLDSSGNTPRGGLSSPNPKATAKTPRSKAQAKAKKVASKAKAKIASKAKAKGKMKGGKAEEADDGVLTPWKEFHAIQMSEPGKIIAMMRDVRHDIDDLNPSMLKRFADVEKMKNRLGLAVFDPAALKKKSQGQGLLCEWILHMLNYYQASMKLKDRREDVMKMRTELDEAQVSFTENSAKLERNEASLGAKIREHDEFVQESEEKQGEATTGQYKVDAANRLLAALGLKEGPVTTGATAGADGGGGGSGSSPTQMQQSVSGCGAVREKFLETTSEQLQHVLGKTLASCSFDLLPGSFYS